MTLTFGHNSLIFILKDKDVLKIGVVVTRQKNKGKKHERRKTIEEGRGLVVNTLFHLKKSIGLLNYIVYLIYLNFCSS